MDLNKIFFFVVLFIFIYFIWKYYWAIQLTFNPQSLSLYTPDDIFPKTSEYDVLVEKGKKYAKTQKVIITTLLRDAASRLPQIKKKVEAVGNLFEDYIFLVVENDSKDSTRKLLEEWKIENPKVVILGKEKMNFPKTDGHSVDYKRISKMVTLRNIYLDYIKKKLSHDYNYVIMWDLDSIASVYLDGILNTMGILSDEIKGFAKSQSDFGKNNNSSDIDVVCAYGIYRWMFFTLFYDTYALLHRNEKFHINDKWKHDIRKGLWELKYNRGDPLVDVDSCFSGFAIYRTDALLDSEVRYDMTPKEEENIECEHVRLHRKLKGRKVVNPSMIHYILLND